MEERIAAQHQRTGLHVLHAQFQRPGSQRELLAGGIAQVAQGPERMREALHRTLAQARGLRQFGQRHRRSPFAECPEHGDAARQRGNEQGRILGGWGLRHGARNRHGKAIAYRITLHTYRLAILFAVADSETRAPNAGESEAHLARNGKRPAIAGRSGLINAQRISGSATDTWRRPCSTAHWCRVAGSACCPCPRCARTLRCSCPPP